MAVIEQRGAERSYRVKVRLKGHPPQSATFKRLSDAKRWAQTTEAAIREGRYFKSMEAKKHTLGDLIDRYIRDVLPLKPRSKMKQESQLKWWRGQIGSYLLCDVSSALIVECRDKLAGTPTSRKGLRSPSTVLRYMAVLSHAFTIAMKDWGWIDDNPLRKVTKPKEAKGRVRFLSDEERERLLAACKGSSCSYLYPIVVLAVSTGMRYGEIINLQWRQIDLGRGRLILHDTKNGERRNVPLVGHAYDVISQLSKVRRIDTGLLFPNARVGDDSRPFEIRKSWRKALVAASIDDFRFHDLRHTTASYLAMNGAGLSEIAEVLGHKTLQMVKRYAHLSEAHTTKVVLALNNRLFGVQNVT